MPHATAPLTFHPTMGWEAPHDDRGKTNQTEFGLAFVQYGKRYSRIRITLHHDCISKGKSRRHERLASCPGPLTSSRARCGRLLIFVLLVCFPVAEAPGREIRSGIASSALRRLFTERATKGGECTAWPAAVFG